MAEAMFGIEHYLWVRTYRDSTELLSGKGRQYVGSLEYRRD